MVIDQQQLLDPVTDLMAVERARALPSLNETVLFADEGIYNRDLFLYIIPYFSIEI